MALLNGIYINVTDESIDEDIEITEHPVEQGADIADHVNVKGYTLKLSGKIVKTDYMSAADILGQINNWKNSKTLINYLGRNYAGSLIISSFSHSHPYTIKSGMEFDMTLREIRTAKNSYVGGLEENSGADSQGEGSEELKIELGAVVVFKGGVVYLKANSDVEIGTRGRSTCKIQKINDGAPHPVQLFSLDGGKVFGWVDLENIENISSDPTKAEINGGTKQMILEDGTRVTHVVKEGDTVYDVAKREYKSMKVDIQQIVDNNPNAFSDLRKTRHYGR